MRAPYRRALSLLSASRRSRAKSITRVQSYSSHGKGPIGLFLKYRISQCTHHNCTFVWNSAVGFGTETSSSRGCSRNNLVINRAIDVDVAECILDTRHFRQIWHGRRIKRSCRKEATSCEINSSNSRGRSRHSISLYETWS